MGEKISGDAHRENKIMQYSWLIVYEGKLSFMYMSRKEYLHLTKKRLDKTIKDDPGSEKYYSSFTTNINN